MARFLKHTACPVCGSSDALGHYDDGSTYCFSHGRSTKQATISPFVTASQQQDDAEDKPKATMLPSDATQNYSAQALAWCAKYEIGVESLLRNEVYYSAARNQLIFGFFADSGGIESAHSNDGEGRMSPGTGRIVAWQARNLSATNKAKRYYTQGDINAILPIYYCCSDSSSGSIVPPSSKYSSDIRSPRRTRHLVLVEDCLSAIKVASIEALGADAMPLLGSSLPKAKLTQLRGFYDLCDVFLDPDMWPKSVLLAKQAQLLGFRARAIKADKDPKELTRENLCQLLK